MPYDVTPDINQAGAAQNPFAYTQGSLLTPWGSQPGQQFNWTGGTAGAYSPPEIAGFNSGAYAFNPTSSGQFGQQAPTAERYADFQAPDAQNFQADPSYQFRVGEGTRALENSAAARGTLLTGGTAKALMGYGQQMGSLEYQNAYNRALQTYGVNRENHGNYFDDRMSSFGGNLSAFGANTAANQGDNQIGLGAAQFNHGIARQEWQDGADAQLRAASAASGNSAQSYNQALQQYQMQRGEFYTNQDRQYNFLTGQADRDARNAAMGMGLAGAYGQNQGSIYTGNANAQAAGQIAQGNAVAGGLGGIANAGMYYFGNQGQQGSPYGAQP
jgi:hypothetical protein